jgi:hypothetical protein
MKYYPMVWILWCNDKGEQGVHIEELFAHKIDAEAYMRACEIEDKQSHYWIQEKKVVQ